MSLKTIPVLWRENGVTQLGVDSGHSVVLKNLTNVEQQFLDQAASRDELDDLCERTIRKGADPIRLAELENIVQEFKNQIPTTSTHPLALPGLEDDPNFPTPPTAVGSRVLFRGLGAVSLTAAKILAESGYLVKGQIDPAAPAQTAWAAKHEISLGKEFLRVSGNETPDFYVVERPRTLPGPLARQLEATHLPYLPVLVSDRIIRVGPWLGGPGRPCWQCLELQHRDADPQWPLLSAQLESLPVRPVDFLEAAGPGGFVARQIHEAFHTSTKTGHDSGQCEQMRWDFSRDSFTFKPTGYPVHPHCANH